MRWLAVVAGAMGVAHAALGCGGGGGRPFNPPHLPMDDVLRLNQLQAEGTHNSYHVESPDNNVPEWHYTRDPLHVQLDSENVRQLELDVHWDDSIGMHRVYHVPIFDQMSVCDRFVDCLEDIKGWSDGHPGHHPIFVMIEPKDQDGYTVSSVAPHLDHLEQEILSVFPLDRLITPDMVRGSAATLRDAVTTVGWPTLGEVRGRVLFFLNCNRDLCLAFAHGGTDLRGRIIFSDSQPGDPFEAVRILNDPVGSQSEIMQAVTDGFIVRTFADELVQALANDTTERDAALQSGAQLLSTDVPVPRDDTPYVFAIPGGTPSRCNPLTAPPSCTSTDIEDPARLMGP